MSQRKELQMIALSHSSPKQNRLKKKRRRRRKFKLLKRTLCVCILLLLICFGFQKVNFNVADRNDGKESLWAKIGDFFNRQQETQPTVKADMSDLSLKLQELLEKNPETVDFVENFSNREHYMNQKINIKDDYVKGEVPLLIQWDKRWGYDAYGQEIIGLAGCGPTCLTMAYLSLTGDTKMNPRKMAEYAYKKGYYTEEGTSWSLWTDGAAGLGLNGYEISLDENVMKSHLDQNELIICSMAPGDFTTTGHFILIRGYDQEGFFVNDPNRRSNSQRQWDFETLRYQIKCLWSIGT